MCAQRWPGRAVPVLGLGAGSAVGTTRDPPQAQDPARQHFYRYGALVGVGMPWRPSVGSGVARPWRPNVGGGGRLSAGGPGWALACDRWRVLAGMGRQVTRARLLPSRAR